MRITIGVEDHVTRGLAALRESLKEIGWTKAQAVARIPHEDTTEREFE